MKILLNFSTLKKGGGQNVALNFIKSFFEGNMNKKLDDYYFLVVKDTAIHKLLVKNNTSKILFSPNNPLKRLLYESIYLNRFLKRNNIDIIYTYFGYAHVSIRFIQITGSVDSNIYYPEIDFWKGYNFITRFKKHIIDSYRKYGLKKSHGIIFENPELERRYKVLFNANKPTITILPSVSLADINIEYKLPEINERAFKGLFLCGWHLNKNIMLIPKIAKEFQDNSIPFHFILTAPEDYSLLHKEFITLCKTYKVENMISIVGSVRKEQLKSLYQQMDYVFLLSKLESFSNNIIESYFFRKPLVIADEPWARQLCKDAAIYVDREDPKSICNEVMKIIDNNNELEKLLEKGDENLKDYPTVTIKTMQELEFVKYVYEKYN